MLARNYFGLGFLRGLNSVAEVFAPYSDGRERSLLGQMRSDWSRPRKDARTVQGPALANTPQDILRASSGGKPHTVPAITSIVSAHWSGPLPPPAELEQIDRIIPGGADRLLRMAETKLEKELDLAETKLEKELKELDMAEKQLGMAEKKMEKELDMAEKERPHRVEDTKRGQYLGWSLAMGAVITAAVVSLCHGAWQVSVALVGIPVLGAVQALIQGRKEKSASTIRWF
jgi:uncharacterized membrane protein